MKRMFLTTVAFGLIAWNGSAQAQESRSEAAAPEGQKAWWEEEESSNPRGFIGGLLGVGFGVNGQVDSGLKAYVDTSLVFGIRGGLLLGKGNRWLLSFEVAPVTNRLDWRRDPTATGFLSFGSLVPIRSSKEWSWLWRVGFGVGGGVGYRFLVGAQLDVLTFNYEITDRLWVDFGVPTIRFHIETASGALYNAQFVFPLGVTFAI